MAQPPRLLIVAQRLAPYDGRFIKTAASFEAAGFEVRAIAPRAAGPSHPRAEEIATDDRLAGAPGLPGRFLRALALRRAMALRGAALRPDLILVYDPEALPAAAEIKRRTGAPLIYDAHELHEEEDPSAPARGAWVRRAETRLAPMLDGFVTVNDAIARLYRERRPGFPDAVVVTNAVDPRPVHPSGRLRAEAGLSAGDAIVLYQGALTPMRGLDRLVRAAALLPEPWRLVLMGSGPLKESLKAAADDARVRFLRPVDHGELLDWTAEASLGALLYEDEGLNQRHCTPNKLWEYPAAGVPILATSLPEVARLVRDNGIGFIAPSDPSPETLARMIGGITPDALAHARGNAATFAAKHTWTASVAPLLALAERLLARSGATP